MLSPLLVVLFPLSIIGLSLTVDTYNIAVHLCMCLPSQRLSHFGTHVLYYSGHIGFAGPGRRSEQRILQDL